MKGLQNFTATIRLGCLGSCLITFGLLQSSAFQSVYEPGPNSFSNAPIALTVEDVISQFNGKPRDLLLIRRYLYEHRDDETSVAELLNQRTDRGSTFLLVACSYASLEAVEFMLDNGANPSLPGQDGVMPLMAVIIGGFRSEPDSDRRVTIATDLLRTTIEVNAQTTSGKTALDFTRSSPQQPRLEALVLKYGGRPGPQDGFPLGYPPVVVWNTRPSALIV